MRNDTLFTHTNVEKERLSSLFFYFYTSISFYDTHCTNAILIASLRMIVVCEIKTFLIINELLAHRSPFCCSQRRPAEPTGSVVDSLVHRLIWRPGGILPHRQLLWMVLSTGRSTLALRATCRDDKQNRSYREPTATLSPIRPAFLRFHQLRSYRRQDVWREAGHLCDLGADS